ncbi:PREDICTED: tenomodulin [Nanorana parkeri]|uniref:tenomodulin n=1 Tax=Nanorana parkeri TaxID=125878 RepID=UPI000854E638|nr:PREDICTED: tenomodulin [Nanorana parkeri]
MKTMLEETGLQEAEVLKPKKWNSKKCAILAVSVCVVVVVSLTLLFVLKDFWKQLPEKVYDAEYKFFSAGEQTRVLMEIDPRNRIETFRTENGSDRALEIHDFKHGITGIYFADLQKCFIKTQSKEIPEFAETELVELEEGEITTTIYEQSVFWVPAQEPIQDREFMRNSRISEICNNASVHWIYPSSATAPEFQDFEDGEVKDGSIMHPNRTDQREDKQNKRQGRSLTEEDLPINDYREVGLEFNPMWDHRGFCCHHCRRGQRYCQKVCEPMLGYYPYPYCYGSGRVICRIIMPCNWWVARMLGRV